MEDFNDENKAKVRMNENHGKLKEHNRLIKETTQMGLEAHSNLMNANVDLRKQRDGIIGLKKTTAEINTEISKGESLVTTMTVK